MHSKHFLHAFSLNCFLLLLIPALQADALSSNHPEPFQKSLPVTITVDLDRPRMITNSSTLFGAGIDGHEEGAFQKMLSPANVETMMTAGLKPLSYRLRTELGIEAWHWNPEGTWSDPKHAQGYWTSSTKSSNPILSSYGYRLPRRGNTLDEANNDSYSRIDDGDPTTFWKSNPYLTSHYTGEPDRKHPQWVMVDFGKPTFINAVRIHWADPYARHFRIQWSKGEGVCFGPHAHWHDFNWGQSLIFDFFSNHRKKIGSLKNQKSKTDPNLKDLGEPKNFFGQRQPVRCVRILMDESSGTAAPGSHDRRDHMGYAIRELEFGEKTSDGVFHDRIIHRPDHGQTLIYTSSTDPWHRACDRDERTEQPGFDFLMHSGLVTTEKNLPSILWAAPVLYDTPENAAAEISFLQQRGYLGKRVELGEEPDGQRIDPADFGALYGEVVKKWKQKCRWESGSQNDWSGDRRLDCHQAALKGRIEQERVSPIPNFLSENYEITNPDPTSYQQSKTDPIFGGPSFVTVDEEPHDVTYRYDHRPWLRRFLKELRQRHQESDFGFLTFEWYPFDEVTDSPFKILPRSATMLKKSATQLLHGGVPASMPLMITEYGYSVFEGEPEVELAAGILNADIAAEFLSLGGTTSYLYGYEPNTLECIVDHSWGNLMMFLQNNEGGISAKLPTFYAAELLTHRWLSSLQGTYQLFPITCQPQIKNAKGDSLLTAYMLQRPDKIWSLLVINKSDDHAYRIHPVFKGKMQNERSSWKAPFESYCYSSAQYQWHADAAHGAPSRNDPPQQRIITSAEADSGILIPPWSISVVSSN